MDKRIGAQLYTIREFCKTLEDFDASCKKIKEIGYQTVQLSGIGDFSGEEIKGILDKHGLEAVCTHRSPQQYLENLDGEIAFHKTIGCHICGLGSMPGFSAKPETVENFIRNFSPVANKLAENGLIFAYHNHAFEFAKQDGRFVFDMLSEQMTGQLKYILDVYWLAVAGLDPAKFIRAHKGQIACVHFKDLKIVGNAPTFAELGMGNLDFDDIIAASEEAGVEYALVEQDTCEGDPFESLKISYEYITSKGFH